MCGNSTGGAIFDSTFVNTAAPVKQIECLLTDAFYQSFVEDSRINITINNDNQTLDFVLFGRPWRHHEKKEPQWLPVTRMLDCHLTECAGHTYKDGNSITKAVYNCEGDVKCSACPACGALIIDALLIKAPITIEFTDFGFDDRTVGSAKSTFISNAAVFHSDCITGTCVNTIPLQNIRGVTKYGWIIILVVSLIVGFSVIYSLMAIVKNCRGRKGLGVFDLGEVGEWEGQPHPNLELVWKNISYVVPAINRKILSNINGTVRSGETLALLGLSGSGKTSLLDIISMRPKVGKWSGTVRLFQDGVSVKPSNGRWAPYVSYMPADESLMPTQTVYETVYFSARLRLPRDLSNDDVHRKVMRTIRDLDLLHVIDSKIGISEEGGGISTGERKRVCIGMELVVDPWVLIMDEPTSGLDSYSASLFLELISRTARTRGLLCIFSIHQPPSNVFNLFNKVLLLTRCGRTAYFGSAKFALEYVTSVVGYHSPNGDTNPSEVLLELSANKDEHIVDRLPHVFEKWEGSRDMREEIDHILSRSHKNHKAGGVMKPSKTHDVEQPLLNTSDDFSTVSDRYTPLSDMSSQSTLSGQVHGSSNSASLSMQITLLSSRAFNHIARDPGLMLLHYSLTLIVAGVIGLVYYKVSNDFGGVQNRAGFFFFMIFFFCAFSLSSVAEFSAERRLFLREKGDRFYSTFAYVVSKLVTDILPMRVIPPMIFGSICYSEFLFSLSLSLLCMCVLFLGSLFITCFSASFTSTFSISFLHTASRFLFSLLLLLPLPLRLPR